MSPQHLTLATVYIHGKKSEQIMRTTGEATVPGVCEIWHCATCSHMVYMNWADDHSVKL